MMWLTADSLLLTQMFTAIAQHVLGPDFTCLCSVLWLWRWGLDRTWVQAMSTMESQSKLSSVPGHMWSAFFPQYKRFNKFFPSFFSGAENPESQRVALAITALTWLLCNSLNFFIFRFSDNIWTHTFFLYMQQCIYKDHQSFCVKIFYTLYLHLV